MKKLILPSLLLLLIGCGKDPPCPPITDQDLTPGIYSKELGIVNIDGETCHIFEQYQTWNCYKKYGHICEGMTTACQWKILTRITKCPSGNHVNSVNQTGGKFSHEEVK